MCTSYNAIKLYMYGPFFIRNTATRECHHTLPLMQRLVDFDGLMLVQVDDLAIIPCTTTFFSGLVVLLASIGMFNLPMLEPAYCKC